MAGREFWFLSALICLTTAVSAQNIQVDDSYTAQQLVEDVLIDSPCANVSNFTVSGDTFSQGEQSYGYFTNTSPNFPFANGIVLSTARAIRSQGPNNNLIDEGSTHWAGDNDLEQALQIQGTFNATVLEFDFTPLTSQISFDYIFASEEYHGTATCIYSDGFAFLLKPAGSQEPYQNLAVIPNTGTPVSVTNVHPEIPGGCPAMNEQYFGSFNPADHPINFNGQTAVMTARATVVPGVTYHIKLVIADEQNIRYDSSIFLGGGSFSVGTDIGPDRLFATNNPLCAGESYVLDATETGPNTYQWFKNDIALSGETNPTYTVTSQGTYSVEVNLGAAGCIATGEAVIEYANPPLVTSPATLVQCDDNADGIAIYDLTRLDEIITQGDQTLTVQYFPTIADAQNNTNQIQEPTDFSSMVGTIGAKITSVYGCSSFATVNLELSGQTVADGSATICDTVGAPDGIATFNLALEVTPDLITGLPSGIMVEYYASAADAMTGTNPLPGNYTNTTPNFQMIFARLVNGPDCYGIAEVNLIVNVFSAPNFEDEQVWLCSGSSVTLQVSAGFSGYAWSTGATTNSISVSMPGIYTVAATDSNGCSGTKTFTVALSGIGTITGVGIDDFAGGANTVTVEFSGPGAYQFSLDGINFQASPVFISVAPGEYQIYIRDLNGCGTPPPTAIFVLDYPRFFTPNGDGINDYWRIKFLDRFPQATVSVFDRYGKLVYAFNGADQGWDGTLNNSQLPSTDYWFVIDFKNARTTVKSHFSLKR